MVKGGRGNCEEPRREEGPNSNTYRLAVGNDCCVHPLEDGIKQGARHREELGLLCATSGHSVKCEGLGIDHELVVVLHSDAVAALLLLLGVHWANLGVRVGGGEGTEAIAVSNGARALSASGDVQTGVQCGPSRQRTVPSKRWQEPGDRSTRLFQDKGRERGLPSRPR